MTYKLSPSSLSLFNDCQRCFYRSQNYKIGRPSGIFPSLPSGMDKVIKEYFDECRKEGRRPEELAALPQEVGLYQDLKQLTTWRNNFKGIRWNDAKGNTLFGAIDDLLQRDETLIVLDHKTKGFKPKEPDKTIDYYQQQLDLYALLFQKNGFNVAENGHILLWYPERVNGSGIVQFATKLYDVALSPANAQAVFEKALEVLQRAEPEAAEKCEYCRR